MNANKHSIFACAIIAFLIMAISFSNEVRAHCDGLDGPVVNAARKALETENVNLVLIWVQKEHADEIRNAFQKTLVVRKLSPQAKELADMYFFETVVRLHREGEGAPYTGLKPAGRDLGPAIPAADESIEKGSAEKLLKLLTDEVHEGLHKHFKAVIVKKNYNIDNIETGRQYVDSYVKFIHYVEGIYEATQKSAHGHFPESEETGVHKH